MGKKLMRGFTLLEVLVGATIFFVIIAVALTSFGRFNKLNLKLEKDLTSDTSFTGFNQAFVKELLNAESSLYFLNMPIPTACNATMTDPCVRYLNTGNKFESTNALTKITGSVQFYRDEFGLLKDFPAYSESNSSRIYANKPLPLNPTILNDKFYTTWPLPVQRVGETAIPNNAFIMLNKREDTSLYFDFPTDFATSGVATGAFTNYVMTKSSIPNITTSLFINNIIVLYNAFETRHYFVRKIADIQSCASTSKCKEYMKLKYPKLDAEKFKSDSDYLIKLDELTYEEMKDYVPAVNIPTSSDSFKYWDHTKKSLYIFPTSVISIRDSAPPPSSSLGSFWPLPNPYSFIHFSQSQGNGNVKVLGIPARMYAYYIKEKNATTESVVRKEYFTNKTVEMLNELPINSKVIFTRRLGTADMSVFTDANVKELESSSADKSAQGSEKKVVLKIADTFSSISNGTVRNNLPRPPAQALKKFYPSKQGQTSIEGNLICGDYDVVTFSTKHPKFDIMRQINDPLNRYWLDASPTVPAQLGTTYGFWIIDSKSNNFFKWYPISSGELTFAPASNSTVLVTAMNTTDGTGSQSLNIAAANYLDTLGKIKTFKMPGASSPVTAKLYVGAQMCNLTQLNSSEGAIPAPSLVKIGAEIYNAIDKTIPDEIDDLFEKGHGDPNNFHDFNKRKYNFKHKPNYDFSQFNYNLTNTSINFSIGNGPYVVKSHPLDQLAEDVLDIDYPNTCLPSATPSPTAAPSVTPVGTATAAPTASPSPIPGWAKGCSLPQFKAAMNANPKLNAVRNLLNTLKSVQNCKDVDPSISDPNAGYFWEYLPYQHTCRTLLSTIPKWSGTMEDALNDLQNPPDSLNHWEFENAKENIAKFLKLGAYANEIQKVFQNKYKAQLEIRNTCVPTAASSAYYIDKVLGSLVVGKRAIDENPVTLTTKHPESAFAISTFNAYYTADPMDGNKKTIYQYNDTATPAFIDFTQGTVYDTTYTSFMNKMGVKFSFNIRAILCCDGSYYSCFC